jgi:hypothetical protein
MASIVNRSNSTKFEFARDSVQEHLTLDIKNVEGQDDVTMVEEELGGNRMYSGGRDGNWGDMNGFTGERSRILPVNGHSPASVINGDGAVSDGVIENHLFKMILGRMTKALSEGPGGIGGKDFTTMEPSFLCVYSVLTRI